MDKLDLTKPYRTREGGEAQAVVGPDGRLYGWHRCLDTGFRPLSWQPNGLTLHSENKHPWDLVNVAETRTVKRWINIYPEDAMAVWGTRADADEGASDDRIACIEREITFHVGEGL